MIHFFSTIQNSASDGYGSVFAANQLDCELRQKYPTIDMMLNIANTMLPPSPQVSRIRSEVDQAIENLLYSPDRPEVADQPVSRVCDGYCRQLNFSV